MSDKIQAKNLIFKDSKWILAWAMFFFDEYLLERQLKNLNTTYIKFIESS